MIQQRKKYSKDFKQSAVNLVLKDKYSIPEACESLSIPESTFRKWIIKAQKYTNHSIQGITAEKKELLAAKKRITQLEEENEILKKASSYFAKLIK